MQQPHANRVAARCAGGASAFEHHQEQHHSHGVNGCLVILINFNCHHCVACTGQGRACHRGTPAKHLPCMQQRLHRLSSRRKAQAGCAPAHSLLRPASHGTCDGAAGQGVAHCSRGAARPWACSSQVVHMTAKVSRSPPAAPYSAAPWNSGTANTRDAQLTAGASGPACEWSPIRRCVSVCVRVCAGGPQLSAEAERQGNAGGAVTCCHAGITRGGGVD